MSFFLKKNERSNSQSRYQPNLVSLMRLCANNYMLLLKLLADKNKLEEQRHFFISEHLSYAITVTEVTRYTSLLTFAQNSENSACIKLSKLIQPSMVVRLYHDARMAEVISSQGVRQVKPRYDYPNADMHQQDEKNQINQFLNEWLHLCLEMGQVDVAVQYQS